MIYNIRQCHRFEISYKDDIIICDNIQDAASLIDYTPQSTKHITSRQGIISKVPYKGYKIRKIR